MTPEDRAAAIHSAPKIRAEIAAAIREAINAETEACACLADDHDEEAERFSDTGRLWRSAAARTIARHIRQRAASRAKPAP